MENRSERQQAREALIAKIRALLSKTVENGATESEALSAAAKAAEMMDRYDLSLDDMDVRNSETKRAEHTLDPIMRAPAVRVAQSVAGLTGTRCWTNGSGAIANKITFYGLAHDVEIAWYLLDLCVNAMQYEMAIFAQDVALLRRRVRENRIHAFLSGMSSRLCDRLDEMAAARRRGATGTALVPLKNQVIEAGMAADGIKLKDCRIGTRDIHRESFLIGHSAGDRVAINPGISEDDRPDELEKDQTENAI